MNQQEKFQRLKSLSILFDSKFEGPLGIKFGLDGILGLLPFVGDFVGAGVSFYILYEAALLGATPSVLVRMGFNILVENLVDMIPVLGNFFDFYWKANNKNMALLETHLLNPSKATFQSRLVLILILLTLIGFLALSFMTLVFVFDRISALF